MTYTFKVTNSKSDIPNPKLETRTALQPSGSMILVNETKLAGRYQIKFDGNNFAGILLKFFMGEHMQCFRNIQQWREKDSVKLIFTYFEDVAQ